MSEMLIIASGKINTDHFLSVLIWYVYQCIFLLPLPLTEVFVMPPLSQGESSNSMR